MHARIAHTLEEALDHQMVFARIRDAIERAREDAWEDPSTFVDIVQKTLEEGASVEHACQGVHIYMRADEWVGHDKAIISPVLPLKDAVRLHQRLLQARDTSWESLRREWVMLVPQTHKTRRQQCPRAEAEAIVDGARHAFLHRRLHAIASKAERELERVSIRAGRDKARMARKRAAEDRQQKRAAMVAATAATRARARRSAQLRRWFRKDLTMDEMMRGPPQYTNL